VAEIIVLNDPSIEIPSIEEIADRLRIAKARGDE
jgi:hypothetical protein